MNKPQSPPNITIHSMQRSGKVEEFGFSCGIENPFKTFFGRKRDRLRRSRSSRRTAFFVGVLASHDRFYVCSISLCTGWRRNSKASPKLKIRTTVRRFAADGKRNWNLKCGGKLTFKSNLL